MESIDFSTLLNSLFRLQSLIVNHIDLMKRLTLYGAFTPSLDAMRIQQSLSMNIDLTNKQK